MPIRVLATLATLLAITIGLIAGAWLTESEIYLIVVGRGMYIARPPTHPVVPLFGLLLLAVITAISRHWAMIYFCFLPGSFVLGLLVGPTAFGWAPSVFQFLLILASGVTAGYWWSQRDYFD